MAAGWRKRLDQQELLRQLQTGNTPTVMIGQLANRAVCEASKGSMDCCLPQNLTKHSICRQAGRMCQCGYTLCCRMFPATDTMTHQL